MVWLVVLAILKNMKVSWEGLSDILWKIKTVPSHRPGIQLVIYGLRWLYSHYIAVWYIRCILYIWEYLIYMYIYITKVKYGTALKKNMGYNMDI